MRIVQLLWQNTGAREKQRVRHLALGRPSNRRRQGQYGRSTENPPECRREFIIHHGLRSRDIQGASYRVRDERVVDGANRIIQGHPTHVLLSRPQGHPTHILLSRPRHTAQAKTKGQQQLC